MMFYRSVCPKGSQWNCSRQNTAWSAPAQKPQVPSPGWCNGCKQRQVPSRFKPTMTGIVGAGPHCCSVSLTDKFNPKHCCAKQMIKFVSRPDGTAWACLQYKKKQKKKNAHIVTKRALNHKAQMLWLETNVNEQHNWLLFLRGLFANWPPAVREAKNEKEPTLEFSLRAITPDIMACFYPE